MAFGTVDDKLWQHEKVTDPPGRDGLAALGLAIRCVSYSNDKGTDGFITDGAAQMLANGDKKLIGKTVEIGWLEKHVGGYAVHNFGKNGRNLTVAQWAAYREEKAVAGRLGGIANAVKATREGGRFTKQVLGENTKQPTKQVPGETLQADQARNPVPPVVLDTTNKPPAYKKATPDGAANSLDAFLQNGIKTGDEKPVADVIRCFRSRGKYDANKDDVEAVLAESSLDATELLMKLERMRLDQWAGQTAKALLNYAALSGPDIATHIQEMADQ